MINFSNCKINIGLYVTGRRTDGFHNIESVLFPVPLLDVLELCEADQTGVSSYGRPIPGDPRDNIVIKAWQVLKQDYVDLPPVWFHLLKNIPAGAGLGAGSANGAYALKALNDRYQLGISEKQLAQYALSLGSDCPFFIKNQPCLAQGRGEVLETIDLDLSGYRLVIVNPGIHIATPWAFQQLTPRKPDFDLKKSIHRPIWDWKHFIFNDFEQAAFDAHPSIAAIKRQLYEKGALFAAMSGSGSTVYGLFEKEAVPELTFDPTYFLNVINP